MDGPPIGIENPHIVKHERSRKKHDAKKKQHAEEKKKKHEDRIKKHKHGSGKPDETAIQNDELHDGDEIATQNNQQSDADQLPADNIEMNDKVLSTRQEHAEGIWLNDTICPYDVEVKYNHKQCKQCYNPNSDPIGPCTGKFVKSEVARGLRWIPECCEFAIATPLHLPADQECVGDCAARSLILSP